MINKHWRDVQRVLLVRLDNLGDVLVTTPAVHAVRQALPHAAFTLLASPVGAQVGRLNPDVADIIEYMAPWMDPWHMLPQDSSREQTMIEVIRSRRFDGAIIFTSFRQSALPAAYLCYLADIPLRLAASIDGPGSLLTTRHKHPDCLMHEVERGLDLVRAIGADTDERSLVLTVPPSARARVSSLLYECGIDSKRPLIVVHPGCSTPARTYPCEQFAEVVRLVVRRLDANVVLTGAHEERQLVDYVYEHAGVDAQHRIHRLAGTLSFPDLCAVIETADVTITNNTGPMHISAAVHTPVIALFALTNPPEQWGPWQVPHRQLYHDVPCRLCYARICPHDHECLRLVTPSDVVKAARELLLQSRLLAEAKRSEARAMDARGVAS